MRGALARHDEILRDADGSRMRHNCSPLSSRHSPTRLTRNVRSRRGSLPVIPQRLVPCTLHSATPHSRPRGQPVPH